MEEKETLNFSPHQGHLGICKVCGLLGTPSRDSNPMDLQALPHSELCSWSGPPKYSNAGGLGAALWEPLSEAKLTWRLGDPGDESSSEPQTQLQNSIS